MKKKGYGVFFYPCLLQGGEGEEINTSERVKNKNI
jgi:hypothetical protein